MFARKAAVTIASAVVMLLARDSHATPPWTERLLTLPGPVAGTIDVGGSIAHTDWDLGEPPTDGPCGACSFNGTGINVEGVLGIASRVDIGLRVGIRGFNDGLPASINEGALTEADSYARMFDQEAFYGGYNNVVYGDGAVSNPELRARVRILHVHHLFELGVEGRSIFPFANGTVYTQIVGVPMALHFGRSVRFDFGAYSHFTLVQNGPILATFDLPAAFWFQVHRRVFLGPMFGFRFYSANVYNTGWANADANLGFGVGVSLARNVDLKMQLYFPRIDDGAHWVGAGVGVGFYFDTANPYYR